MITLLLSAALLAAPQDTTTVMLGGRPVRIRQVRVSAPPIGQYGDTLSYRVDNFADIEDKSIGDVLRKMPGIEVTDGGEIKYRGEPINRFYVEGNDLLGGRYGLATNNISHRDVAAVELMENHQPIRALKDIAPTDRAALNLRLKPSARARWVGTLGAGGGAGSAALGSGSLFAMRIGRGWQSIQNLAAQNAGGDPAAENREFSLADLLRGVGEPLLSDRIRVGTSTAPIDPRRTRFNRSLLVNTTNSRKLSGDYSLNLRLNYAADRASGWRDGRVAHHLAGGDDVVEERERGSVRRHDLSVVARLEGNRERFFLKNELRADLSSDDRRVTIDGTYPNLQRARMPSVGAENDFELVRRTGRRTLTVTSRGEYALRPHRLWVDETRSEVREEAFRSHSSVSYGWTVRRWLLDARAGVSVRAQKLDGSEAAGSLTTLRGYVAPAATYRSARLRAVLSTPLNVYYYGRRGRFVSSPSLSARWSATARWTLAANASAGSRPIEQSLVYRGTIRRDYRRFETGWNEFSGGSAASFGIRAEYKNPLRTLFASGSLARSWSRTKPMADQRFEGEYIYTSYLPRTARGKSWTAQGNLSKGIDGVNSTVELNLTWSRTDGQTAQNGTPTDYRSEMLSIEPRFKGRLARWCTAEYSLSLRRTGARWLGTKSRTDNAAQRLSVTLAPTKKFFVTLGAEHYLSDLQNLLLADASATWRPTDRWEFVLSADNLFDRRAYAYTLYGALSTARHAFRLRPREVLLSASMRF